MTPNLPFHFAEPSDARAQVFCVIVPGEIHSQEQLLKNMYELLQLPGYFGFNWDALHECLRDLSWIAKHKIVLIHDRLPGLPESQLKIYLEILSDAGLSWKTGEEHQLDVVFPEACRENIKKILAD